MGWGRKGRGTEREGNGAEGKKGGKGGGEERERDGREMEGTGIGGGGSLRHGLWGGWTPVLITSSCLYVIRRCGQRYFIFCCLFCSRSEKLPASDPGCLPG